MAKDDYYVIVYQILSYLYECLKKGRQVDPEMLKENSTLIMVNRLYWEYIITHLVEQNYIEGVTITKAYGGGIT